MLLTTALLSSLLYSKNTLYQFEKMHQNTWVMQGDWKVFKTSDHGTLILNKESKKNFNLCYTKEILFLNGTISVKFKANSGRIDQGGGLMWRVQDNDNYYVARFNPLEDNFRFYLVHDGIRSELASADVKLSKGWHTMHIEQHGDTFKGYLDDKPYLEYQDKHLNKTGGVGLWTKADALTSFDDLKIETSTETKK